MNKYLKKTLKYTLRTFILCIILIISSVVYLYKSADMCKPEVSSTEQHSLEKIDNYTKYGENYLKKDSCGLWELKIQGEAYSRGRAQGILMKDLLHFQEKVFVDKIYEIVPSKAYVKFLRFFIQIFNRRLGENITEEYRKEILGISESCTTDYNEFGTPYQRQLNYHGAHDIGHTMQDYMLVGCTSFATWGERSKDSTLIIGRNFDFYVGDDFAKNKLVTICSPETGYKFVSIGWAGMIGVLSGMNEKGLSITINAAKASVPRSAKTPISILAREILQYASTIEEAYEIAKNREVFVSESLLIGSAKDGKAAIIEKSPDKIALFHTKNENQIICTNHFQSDVYASSERNINNIKSSDSNYRYTRVAQLIDSLSPMNATSVARILREKKGVNGEDIGLSNPMAIDQQIAHHSVIFKPQQKIMYISTAPWQEGKYVAYDLSKIFKDGDFSKTLHTKSLEIAADSVFLNKDYKRLVYYRQFVKEIKDCIKHGKKFSKEEMSAFIASNPNMYLTYKLLGDYCYSVYENQDAVKYWKQALTKQIPYENEIITLQADIDDVQNKQK